MTSSDLRKKYLKFFEDREHKIVPSSSLVPENDPTTLFTSAGMQPMVPYLLGEPHPEGKRIVDSQKVFRSVDIDEVGVDARHLTFFEMLGNWSFGDYWKEDQLKWFFEFLTTELGIDPNRLYVSAFEGDSQIPKDEETVQIWQKLFQEKGIDAQIGQRIVYYPAHKNWWSRGGTPDQMPAGEPGGPDSEVFYEFPDVPHNPEFGENCHPNCDCGRFVEIGNSVFMQYQKQEDGTFKELPNKNVDFGGGLERLLMAANNQPDSFKNDNHFPIIEKACQYLEVNYEDTQEITKNLRIIADHIKSATFLIKDGVVPSNKLQGYVLRRLLRRAAIKIHSIKDGSMDILPKLVDPILDIYKETGYFQQGDWNEIRPVIEEEVFKFQKTIKQGLKEIEKVEKIDGKTAFNLYQSYGFPIEITAEIAKERGQEINMDEYQQEIEKHRQLSQTTSAGMFKGGLADQTEQTTKLHTATHLLQAAAKQVLGKEVGQRGSHITAERLRWDFNYNQKLSEDQIKQLEEIVNQKIQEDLKVWFDIEDRDQAISDGATTNHGENYPDKVKVYKIATPSTLNPVPFSIELCGGPHVENTSVLGHFKIIKEEGISAGIRRIYAKVE